MILSFATSIYIHCEDPRKAFLPKMCISARRLHCKIHGEELFPKVEIKWIGNVPEIILYVSLVSGIVVRGVGDRDGIMGRS
jgi:hypothetical protein